MRRVDIRTIPDGALLARPLVDQRGVVVLAAGKTISETMRERLWERGFRHAYIEARGFEGLRVQEPLADHTYQSIRHLLAEAVATVRRSADPGEVRLPVTGLLEATALACEDLARQQEDFLLYPPWGTLADRFVTDSINVAVVAARVGFAVLGEESARHLFLAGLLQDLGRWLDDRPNEHVAVSLAMVRGIREINAWVKHIIADHHERLDGSGYPQGKKGEALHPLCRVMSVAVAYLDLITRPRRPTLPHEAQEHLMAEAGEVYDLKAVQALRRVLPGYPTGTVVRLSTRRIGVVVHPGPASLNRPRVRLLGLAAGGDAAVPNPTEESESADEMVGQRPLELDLEEHDGARPPAPGTPVSYEEVDLAVDHSVAIVEVLDR